MNKMTNDFAMRPKSPVQDPTARREEAGNPNAVVVKPEGVPARPREVTETARELRALRGNPEAAAALADQIVGGQATAEQRAAVDKAAGSVLARGGAPAVRFVGKDDLEKARADGLVPLPGGNAAYDPKTNTILVADGMVKKGSAEFRAIVRSGFGEAITARAGLPVEGAGSRVAPLLAQGTPERAAAGARTATPSRNGTAVPDLDRPMAELKAMAGSPKKLTDLALALGGDASAGRSDQTVKARADALRTAIVDGPVPQIRLAQAGDPKTAKDPDVLPEGVRAAYDAKSNTILVNKDVWEKADAGTRATILREELFESVAARVGTARSETYAGDAGERLRRVAEGGTPAEAIAAEAQSRKVEPFKGDIRIDGSVREGQFLGTSWSPPVPGVPKITDLPNLPAPVPVTDTARWRADPQYQQDIKLFIWAHLNPGKFNAAFPTQQFPWNSERVRLVKDNWRAYAATPVPGETTKTLVKNDPRHLMLVLSQYHDEYLLSKTKFPDGQGYIAKNHSIYRADGTTRVYAGTPPPPRPAPAPAPAPGRPAPAPAAPAKPTGTIPPVSSLPAFPTKIPDVEANPFRTDPKYAESLKLFIWAHTHPADYNAAMPNAKFPPGHKRVTDVQNTAAWFKNNPLNYMWNMARLHDEYLTAKGGLPVGLNYTVSGRNMVNAAGNVVFSGGAAAPAAPAPGAAAPAPAAPAAPAKPTGTVPPVSSLPAFPTTIPDVENKAYRTDPKYAESLKLFIWAHTHPADYNAAFPNSKFPPNSKRVTDVQNNAAWNKDKPLNYMWNMARLHDEYLLDQGAFPQGLRYKLSADGRSILNAAGKVVFSGGAAAPAAPAPGAAAPAPGAPAAPAKPTGTVPPVSSLPAFPTKIPDVENNPFRTDPKYAESLKLFIWAHTHPADYNAAFPNAKFAPNSKRVTDVQNAAAWFKDQPMNYMWNMARLHDEYLVDKGAFPQGLRYTRSADGKNILNSAGNVVFNGGGAAAAAPAPGAPAAPAKPTGTVPPVSSLPAFPAKIPDTSAKPYRADPKYAESLKLFIWAHTHPADYNAAFPNAKFAPNSQRVKDAINNANWNKDKPANYMWNMAKLHDEYLVDQGAFPQGLRYKLSADGKNMLNAAGNVVFNGGGAASGAPGVPTAPGGTATANATASGISTPVNWTWADPRGDGTLGKYNSFAATGPKKGTVVVVGDSLSSNDAAGTGLYGLGNNWVTHFAKSASAAGYATENYARSSSATTAVPGNGTPSLASGSSRLSQALGAHGDTKLVIIALGTNDPRRNVSADGTYANLKAMGDAALAKGAKVMFIPSSGTDATLQNWEGVKFNAAEKAAFSDIWSRLGKAYAGNANVKIGPQMYSGGLHSDGIHTSAGSQAGRGASFWSAASGLLGSAATSTRPDPSNIPLPTPSPTPSPTPPTPSPLPDLDLGSNTVPDGGGTYVRQPNGTVIVTDPSGTKTTYPPMSAGGRSYSHFTRGAATGGAENGTALITRFQDGYVLASKRAGNGHAHQILLPPVTLLNGTKANHSIDDFRSHDNLPVMQSTASDGSTLFGFWDGTNGRSRNVLVTPQMLAQMTSQTGPAGFRVFAKPDGSGYQVALEFDDNRNTRIWGNFDWSNKLVSTETEVNPPNTLVAERPGHDNTGTSGATSATFSSPTVISVQIPALGNIVGAVGALAQGFVEVTDFLGRKVRMLADDAWNALKEGARTYIQIGEKVITGIKKAGQFIADKVEDFALMIGRSVLDFANDLKDSFVRFAQDVARKATAAFGSVKGLAESAGSGLASAWNAVGSKAPEIDAVIRHLTSGPVQGSAGPASVSMAAIAAGNSFKAGAEAKVDIKGAQLKREQAFEVVARAAGLGRTNFGLFFNSVTKAGTGTPEELPAGVKAEVSDAFRVGATGQLLVNAPSAPGVQGGSGLSWSDFMIGIQRGVDAFVEFKAGAVSRKIGVFANIIGALQWKIGDAGAAMVLPDGIEVNINAGLKSSTKYSFANMAGTGISPFVAMEQVAGVNIFKGNIKWPNPS